MVNVRVSWKAERKKGQVKYDKISICDGDPFGDKILYILSRGIAKGVRHVQTECNGVAAWTPK